MHQAVQGDLPKKLLCSGKTEEEPIKNPEADKIQGNPLSEKCRKLLTEPKQSMAAQVILALNHQSPRQKPGLIH